MLSNSVLGRALVMVSEKWQTVDTAFEAIVVKASASKPSFVPPVSGVLEEVLMSNTNRYELLYDSLAVVHLFGNLMRGFSGN